MAPLISAILCVGLISQTYGEMNDDSASPPFDYNPLLDGRPLTPNRERSVEWTRGASGLRIGTYAGISFGSAASYLSPRISSLDLGTFPLFGLSLGVRLGADQPESFKRRFELTLNTALGFGRTFERSEYDNALDVHLRPSLTFHISESQAWGLSASASLNLIVFDVEDGEVSQVGVGPAFAPRFTWKMSDLSQLYFELHWSPLYDVLAYSFREPTASELEDNPDIVEVKMSGQWFNHYQALFGLRLLGF